MINVAPFFMMARPVRWAKAALPVRKKTHLTEVQRLEQRIDALQRDAHVAWGEARNLRSQLDATGDITNAQARLASALLEIRDTGKITKIKGRAFQFAAMNEPRVEFVSPGDHIRDFTRDVSYHNIHLEQFIVQVGVGLSEHTYPEMVVEQVCHAIRKAILTKWRNQSLLKEFGQ